MAMETEHNGIAWNLPARLGADEWQWNCSGACQQGGGAPVVTGSRRREAPFGMDDRGRRKLHKPCEDSAFISAKRAHTLKLLLNGAKQVYSQKPAQALQDRQGEACGAERPMEYCGGNNCQCNCTEASPRQAQPPTADSFRVRSLDTWLNVQPRVEPAAAGAPESKDSKSGMDWTVPGQPVQAPQAGTTLELQGHGVAMQAEMAASPSRCASCGRGDGFAWEDCTNDTFSERLEGAICVDCYSSGTMAEA